jgi:hypothetical protein
VTEQRDCIEISLQRAFSPEIMRETECGLCGLPFRVQSVVVVGPWAYEVCSGCVRYFGERNPERFPTIEEYRAACARYPEPIWGSNEEAGRAEEDEAAYGRALEASWIRR